MKKISSTLHLYLKVSIDKYSSTSYNNTIIFYLKEEGAMPENYCIITFESTHHAIASEQLLLNAGYHIRIIPVPTEITASCGLSIRFDQSDYAAIRPLLSEFLDVRYYNVLFKDRKKVVLPI